MIKEDIEKQLEEFLEAEKNCPPSQIDTLCRQFNMRRIAKRQPSKFGKRNPKIPRTRWESIDLDSGEFNKPVVVCLSGNGTIDAAMANGFCKTVENMLGLLFKGKSGSSRPLDYIDLIGCAYGKNRQYLYLPDSKEIEEMYSSPADYAQDFPQAVKESYDTNDLAPSEIDKLVNNLLVKGCVDERGNKLSVDKCCKNLSQITFCSFCYGARAVNNIINNFERTLKMHNFNKEEIDAIKNSMAHISFARLDYARNIPSVYFYSVDDFDIEPMLPLVEEMHKTGGNLKTRHSLVGEGAFGQEICSQRFGKVADCEALEYVYKGASQDDGPSLEHYVANVSRDVAWNIINKNVVMYDAISQMMSWALCRAVENGLQNAEAEQYIPKQSMQELNKEIMSIYKSFDKEKEQEK